MSAVATTEDIAFIDRLLESWAAWARGAGIPRCSQSSLRYSTGSDALRATLMLTDDEFGSVDRAVSKLAPMPRAIVHVHYSRSENESRYRKATLCGLTVPAYARELLRAQLDVLEALGPLAYGWQTL